GRALGRVALALLVGSVGCPARASTPVPDVYGLYAIEGDQLVDGAQAPDAELGPSVRFLFFDKAVALGDTDISLRQSAYVRYHIDVGAWVVPDAGPVAVTEVRPVDEWSQPRGSGFRRPIFVGKVELAVEPVPG